MPEVDAARKGIEEVAWGGSNASRDVVEEEIPGEGMENKEVVTNEVEGGQFVDPALPESVIWISSYFFA